MKVFLEKNLSKFKDFMSQNKVEEMLGSDKKKIWSSIGNYVNRFNGFDDEEKALRVGGFFDFLSAILKFVVGFLTGSIVIISSAVDCAADFFTSIFNIILFRRSKKPSDEKFNYGYGKLQGLGAVVQSGLIMIATIFLIYESIRKIIIGLKIKWIDLILVIIIFDIILVIISLVYHLKAVKGSKNIIVKSSLMKAITAFAVDIGIIISFVIIKFTNPPFFKLDPIVSLIISVFILHGLYGVVKTGMDMLMDKSLDPDELKTIDEAIKASSDQIVEYKNFKTRKSGENKFIDFDLVLKKELNFDDVYCICITVKENIANSISGANIMINPIPVEE